MKKPRLEIDTKTDELLVIHKDPSFSPEYSLILTAVHGSTLKKIVIKLKSSKGETPIYIKTMHVSRKSDTYQPGHNYRGVTEYQHNSQSEWWTANNTHCKSGYIVIKTQIQKMLWNRKVQSLVEFTEQFIEMSLVNLSTMRKSLAKGF